MFRKILIIILSYVFVCNVYSQPFTYNPAVDVLHYDFNVKVTDDNDSLMGHAFITVKILQHTNKAVFDLISLTAGGKGMVVTEVKEHNSPVVFTHQNDQLIIEISSGGSIVGEVKKFEIKYNGIPADGLIFSKNKFGHRTIFGDNWPNRARNWLPCVDHLSDKASVDFIVTAPDHYQVVSNGLKVEETNLSNHLRLTHWKEEVPLPTKVMVIGLADFAVSYLGNSKGVPVSSWVFPEERTKGFYDYAQAAEILPFYIKNIGPYSYEKLANVQSKTIYGGMENAGAIFYSQRSITGKRTFSEELMAHEIAHQWFGDAVTESDWPHIWLSEGFATEMTNLYLENKYGKDTLIARLQNDRDSVIVFSHKRFTPVVDTTEKEDLIALLNHNSYAKGGWILHMLRRKLGDVIFWKAIRLYYATYRNKNASTRDLQHVFEKVSGSKLENFFTQWLYTAENPVLEVDWEYSEKTKLVTVIVTQLQEEKIFTLPLQIGIISANGVAVTRSIPISKKVSVVSFRLAQRPVSIQLDPKCNLLFEGTVKEQKGSQE
jgi:aminopeptidase N